MELGMSKPMENLQSLKIIVNVTAVGTCLKQNTLMYKLYLIYKVKFITLQRAIVVG
jgi:hypothetical protein